jgi:predicted O-methyltransferase YrrM
MQLPANIDSLKGFLQPEEGAALYDAVMQCQGLGPVLEIGSYCGKSTVYIGAACRETNTTVFALDHHRGSEEHQVGEMFHDEELFDGSTGYFDTFKEFRKNIQDAGLNEVVVPLVSTSEVAAKNWHTPLAMVFIDGGHSLDAALTDYRCWASHIPAGGILAIHDVFTKSIEGGQAPHAIYKLALNSGLFEHLSTAHSLRLLRRL